ncbi:MAG: flagellar hook-basal body complex protein [Planctomycetota bacterium]
MASTNALFTGLTGLNAHSRMLDVIGNNIANTNTTAFKSSRVQFESAFSRTLGLGSAPGDTTGGTNPAQVGLGVGIAGIKRDFSTGALNPTGDSRDLAIDGSGFFMVERDGQAFYTRAGSFRQDLNDNLVTISGERLQGYAVDDEFNIIEGALTDINIPIGKRTIAEASRNASIAGNLDASGELPSAGTTIDLSASLTAGFGVVTGAAPAPTAPNVIEPTTRLVDIADVAAGTGTPLFADGQTFELTGATKGDRLLPDAQLEITATTTVQELTDFLTSALGIQATGVNPDGGVPGVALDPLTGLITVTGNTGSVNHIEIEPQDMRLLDTAGNQVSLPITAQETGEADGESVRTTMVVYDSLGTELTVDVTMSLIAKTETGTTWRYDLESADDTDLDLALGTGTVDFDTAGQLVDNTPITVLVNRDNTGALSPMSFSLRFDSDNGRTTALSDAPSQIANVFRDGLPPGTLDAFGVGPDGVISGSFSNGALRTLGQVVIAGFANDEGLIDAGNNNFLVGPNSGPAVVAQPGQLGTGGLVSGALELSNVDLGREFTDLILTQTGYSASARVISTTDELIQQLLVLGR